MSYNQPYEIFFAQLCFDGTICLQRVSNYELEIKNQIELYLKNLNYDLWVDSPLFYLDGLVFGLTVNDFSYYYDISILVISDDYYTDHQIEQYNICEGGTKLFIVDLRDGFDTNLMSYATLTGGEYLKYSEENIEYLKQLVGGGEQHKTDTDGDKIPDVFEINGIPICNGQLITGCDYEKKHSDRDGLEDGEEISPELQYCPIDLSFGGKQYFVKGYYFHMNSNPMLEDTDGDGYWDDVEINEYHSDPKTKDVIKHQLKQPFISIEGSYGGDQHWFDDSDVWSTDYIINNYGCGLISISDVILYVSNSMGIQSPAGNFINTDELNNIPKEEYMNYIRYMDEFYFDLIRGVGLNGISMEWDFNFFCWSNNIELTADWNIDALSTQDFIFEMLDNDIPVTLAIGPDDNFGVKFYNALVYSTDKSYYLEDEKGGVENDHYVTVTGAIENKIKDNIILEISSCGEKYYIDFDEYEVFVAQHSNYTFSNILYIYPD